MTRPKDEIGSQVVSSESDISYPILVYLSRNNNSQAPARRFISGSDSSEAWISSDFRIQVRSADECMAPGRRQPRETRWTFDGRLSSPETNLKVGLLPLFFMQLLLSHMFLSFMVRTSPLIKLVPLIKVRCTIPSWSFFSQNIQKRVTAVHKVGHKTSFEWNIWVLFSLRWLSRCLSRCWYQKLKIDILGLRLRFYLTGSHIILLLKNSSMNTNFSLCNCSSTIHNNTKITPAKVTQ